MKRFVIMAMIVLVVVLEGSLVSALTIKNPKEGAVFEVGEEIVIRIEQDDPKETEKGILISVGSIGGHTDFVKHVKSLPYEFRYTIPANPIGPILISALGYLVDADTTIYSRLPPTTTVTGIGASFTGRKKTFLDIARKASGELVVTEGTRSTDRISVSAFYSDDVMRDVTDYSKIKYTSSDEKVAIVIPPVQEVESNAQVKATGPGTTDIIIQYGEHTARVTVKVKECPYIEGVTDKRGCPMR